jgi:photosystem II stability/assembly factor-like uncharacterized protein
MSTQRIAVVLAIVLGACGTATAPPDAETGPANTDVPRAPGPDAGSLPDVASPLDVLPSADSGPRPVNPCIAAGTCPPNTWIEVTPRGLSESDFGPGPVVPDPARPSHLYFGGYDDGLWRSTDYGNTWSQINRDVPPVAQGLGLAVGGTTPATIWVARGCACGRLLKSTDGGMTFRETGTGLPEDADFYSFVVDPYDNNHLLSGLHEANGIVESTDGGETWRLVTGAGFPSGGKSWFPFFINHGSAAATRQNWFAIAQDGGSPAYTTDGGAHWIRAMGVDGLQHPHGNAQMHQDGANLYIAGFGGVYRSTDWGVHFTRIHDGNYAIVWGTPSRIYAAYAWACGRDCMAGPDLIASPVPGDRFASSPTPPGIGTGPNHVAVTNDGTHNVFIATMWWSGVWRYVEGP